MVRDAPSPHRLPALFGIFCLGVALALLLWHRVELPFSNPMGVVSRLAEMGYNPATNFARFALFVGTPLVLLGAAFLFGGRALRNRLFIPVPRPALADRRETRVLANKRLLIVFFLLVAVAASNMPTYNIGLRDYSDIWHEGEILAPATSWTHGQTPYEDFTFIHGLIQDPLRPVLAFKLFGKSIGAVRTFSSLLKIAAWLLFGLYLLTLFKDNVHAAFVAMLLLILLATLDRNELMKLKSREIMTFSFLILLNLSHWAYRSGAAGNLKLFILNYLTSLAAFGAFVWSVDRGVYLSVACLATGAAMYFLYVRGQRSTPAFLAAYLAGAGTAMLVFLSLTGFRIEPFFTFVFLEMSRYIDLYSGAVYPLGNRFSFTSLALIAGCAFTMFHLLLSHAAAGGGPIRGLASFLRENLPELALLMLCVFYFRNALSRSFTYTITPVSFTFFTLSIFLFMKYAGGKLNLARAKPVIVYILPLVVMSLAVSNILSKDMYAKYFPLDVKDEQLFPEDYIRTVRYLQDNMAPDDTFYTLTSEGVWFYLLDRPSPVRFPLVLFAAPAKFQDEVVRDLKGAKPKFIIYRNAYWSNQLDDIPAERIVSRVFDYVKGNYSPHKTIGNQEIWIRTGQPAGKETLPPASGGPRKKAAPEDGLSSARTMARRYS